MSRLKESPTIRRVGKKDPDYRKALEELEREVAVQAESVPNGWIAEEGEVAVQAGPVPNGRKAKEEEPKSGRKEGVLGLEDGCVYRKGMLWIPNNKNLIRQVLESEHNTKVAGHMGQDKTIELIRRNFWWPKMDEEIKDFVRSCLQCQKNKAARHQPYGLLTPIELPYTPW
jgi:hypothetical protein